MHGDAYLVSGVRDGKVVVQRLELPYGNAVDENEIALDSLRDDQQEAEEDI
jgi:hypothetical protein